MTEAERDTTHQQALDTLITLATDLARRIHQAATQPEPELTLEQAATTLDKAARIVRRTVLLAQRLPTLRPPRTDRTQARRQVIRTVEDALHTVARHDPDRHDALRAEFHERLDREDFEQDLRTRPLPDLIEEIKQDLGAAYQGRSFVHVRRTPANLDQLNRRAAHPAGPATPAQPPPRPPGQPPP